MSRYVYQRTGGPLVQWGAGAPPHGYRAADTVALGAWAPIRPGAPEMIGASDWPLYAGMATVPIGVGVGYYASGVTGAVIGGMAAGILRPWAAGAVLGYMVKGGLQGIALGLGAGLIWGAVTR